MTDIELFLILVVWLATCVLSFIIGYLTAKAEHKYDEYRYSGYNNEQTRDL